MSVSIFCRPPVLSFVLHFLFSTSTNTWCQSALSDISSFFLFIHSVSESGVESLMFIFFGRSN